MTLYLRCRCCKKKHTILYVVKNNIWGCRRGTICLECIREQLNRDMTLEDFSDAYGNFWIFANPWVLDLLNKGIDVTLLAVRYLYHYILENDDIPYHGHHLGFKRIETEIYSDEYIQRVLRRLES